jgi:hypothetical protein
MRTLIFLLAALLLPSTSLAQSGTAVGAPVSEGKALKADIEFLGAVPWVAYSDYATEFQLHVKKFEDGAWQEVGPVPKGMEAGVGGHRQAPGVPDRVGAPHRGPRHGPPHRLHVPVVP